MRFKKLDLNLLTALDHMIELRSVSAAADKMFMSQSAMSNALRRLQVGRRMEITPRAEEWHEYRAHDPGTVWLRDIMLQAAKSMA